MKDWSARTDPINRTQPAAIPVSFQDGTKARRIWVFWRGANQAPTRSGRSRLSHAAQDPENQRIGLIWKAMGIPSPRARVGRTPGYRRFTPSACSVVELAPFAFKSPCQRCLVGLVAASQWLLRRGFESNFLA